MQNFTVEIDLNNIMLEMEDIIKGYLQIEDLDCCLFILNQRFPIDKSKLYLYNKNKLSNQPNLPLYSTGLVNDIIYFYYYMDNPYKELLFNNKFTKLHEYSNLSTVDMYRISNGKYKTLDELIKSNILGKELVGTDGIALKDLCQTLFDHIAEFFSKNNLPRDRVFTIDDEGIKHKLKFGENILTLRAKEVGFI